MSLMIPDLMRHRARALGAVGEAWLNNVETVLANVAGAWNLQIGEQLSGGTEALVFAANSAQGPSVLKLGIPNSLARECQVLRIGDSRAYAKLLTQDTEHDAMLIERLGQQLAQAPMESEQHIRILCDTLKLGWAPMASTNGLMTGAEKAQVQADVIAAQWAALGRPCAQGIVDQALAFAAQRKAAYDPANSYLIHGDAHIWNTLQAPNSPTGYKFIDPDGLVGECAIDLAISLREWRDELLAGDTLQLGLERCGSLSELTGIDAKPIWQWGFIEHVACGLQDVALSDLSAADKHFEIAAHWLDGSF